MIHSIEYKKVNEIFGGLLANLYLSPLFKRKHISLDYGVMVAQQVLVLFVQVRILVVQRRKALKEISFGAFFFCGCKVTS